MAKEIKCSVRFEPVQLESVFSVFDALSWLNQPDTKEVAQFAGIDPRTVGKVIKNSLQIGLINEADKVEDDKLHIKQNHRKENGNDLKLDEELQDENEEKKDDGTEDQNKVIFKKNSSASNNISVNIDVNSSMDPEKLEKFLKLLKNYGAI